MRSCRGVAAVEDRGAYTCIGELVQEPEGVDRRRKTVGAGGQNPAAGPTRRHPGDGARRDSRAIDCSEHDRIVQRAPLAAYLDAYAPDTALPVGPAQHRQTPSESIAPRRRKTRRNPTHTGERGHEQQCVG